MLSKQLGNYGYQTPHLQLEQSAQDELMAGVKAYQDAHEDKVTAYLKAKNETNVAEYVRADDPYYFRKAFLKKLEKLDSSNKNQFTGNKALREVNPKIAAISLTEFLGEKLAKLYELALEEEMYDANFRQAVLHYSTTTYKGFKNPDQPEQGSWEKWAKRPVIWVAGPSASGKSFASQAAVKKADEFLPKIDGDFSGNHIVSVDGGIIRETSQIRKVVIQACNNKGYSGIKDLHKKSHVLEKMKGKLLHALYKSPDIGIAIPETFSSWLVRWLPSSITKIMKKIKSLPNTIQIMSVVEGKNISRFQRIARFLGGKRAWKNTNFTHKALDLNNKKITESKAYGKRGFKFGINGSQNALSWYEDNHKQNLRLTIVNDLILLKQNIRGDWVEAEEQDSHAELISESAFAKWQELKSMPENRLTAAERELAHLSLPEFHAKQPAIIKTSGEVDLSIAAENIRKKLAAHKHYAHMDENMGHKIGSLETVLVSVQGLNTKNMAAVKGYCEQLKSLYHALPIHRAFTSDTRDKLQDVIQALEKIQREHVQFHKSTLQLRLSTLPRVTDVKIHHQQDGQAVTVKSY